ncbi:hypothetical protein ACS0PU_005320 [Formica fusca]
MDSNKLNKLSLAQLQQEVRNYGYTDIPKTRAGCIDLILMHLEKNGPLSEASDSQPQEAWGEALPLTTAQTFVENTTQGNTFDNYQDQNSNPGFPQFCMFMKETMQRQQDMINQLVMALTLCQRPAHVQSHYVSPVSTPRDLDINEKFSAATGNAVKFLSSQIPHFGGTEDESIDLWIEKIESVSDLHSLLFPGNKVSSVYNQTN